MKYVKLGNTGLSVSRICLGMMSYGNSKAWMLDTDEARPLINKALDLGINFFDTADVYSGGRSEEITGDLLNNYRDEVIIATKVYFSLIGFGVNQKPNKSGLSRLHIKQAIKNSLKRLNMDYVDLYQIHRLDRSLPIEEIIRSLNYLINEGKVLHIGASSMYAWEFVKSLWKADKLNLEPFKTMQNHYNLVYREEEREMLPLCKDQRIGILPWSPLARGFLSGKYKRNAETNINSIREQTDKLLSRRYFRSEDFDVIDQLKIVANEKDVTPSQIALSWLFSKDYVTSPILGATKIEHLEQAAEALEIKLTKDDINRLEKPYSPHPILW